jgi:hypothetical protein
MWISFKILLHWDMDDTIIRLVRKDKHLGIYWKTETGMHNILGNQTQEK